MLEHDVYRRMRLGFIGCTASLSAETTGEHHTDYFMLVCGPVSARYQTLASDGALFDDWRGRLA